MYLYFFIIRIAAFFGHKKARMLVEGQKETLRQMTINQLQLPHHPIWFHAASVGEFEQARPLIERLRQQQPERPVIVTFFSPSGFELRKHYDKVDGVYYLPFATRANVKKWLDVMQPSMAIFVKYEFWPAYLRELKARAIPTYTLARSIASSANGMFAISVVLPARPFSKASQMAALTLSLMPKSSAFTISANICTPLPSLRHC